LKDYKKSKIFNLNKKINGKLDLSSNKIVSNNTLIKSFESKIKFMNGNIIIDRMLLNLAKKLGAADITGIIENEKDSSNFKFEKNIFIDNSKRFYNKFGIYNKEDSNINLFVSGNFDLINLVLRLNEIYDDKNFEDDDVSYVEKEFNDLLLEDGYKSLFNFSNVKEFVKLISAEVN